MTSPPPQPDKALAAIPKSAGDLARMTLGEHLEDLRRRMILALLGLLPLVALAFYFGDDLLALILRPAQRALMDSGQGDMAAVGPLETFSAYMRVSIIAALVVGSPWVLYQLWRFVAPGLHRHERRFVYFLLPLSAILTTSGLVFLYAVVMPLILGFLVTFSSGVSPRTHETAEPPSGVVLPVFPVLAADPPAPRPGEVWINSTTHKLRVAIPAQPTPPQNTPAQSNPAQSTPAPTSTSQPAPDASTAPAGATDAAAPSASPAPAPVTDAAAPAPQSIGVLVLSAELYRDTGLRQQWRVSEVLSMILTLLMAFALAFQAPIVVLLLGWAGVVDRPFLAKYRRHALLVCTILAAAIMPGDPASMVSMMVPLYLLYELGGLLLWVFPASRIAGTRPDQTSPTREDEDDRP